MWLPLCLGSLCIFCLFFFCFPQPILCKCALALLVKGPINQSITTHARGRTQTYAKFFSCILCPSCYMFRPWASLPANTCLMLVAFQDPELQLAIDRCFQNPAHKPKVLRTSVSLGDLAWFLNMFYWEVLAVRWSLSCVDSLHLT